MSKDEKQHPAREPIAVKVLRFRESTDVPSKSGCSALTANEQQKVTIEFLPWLRCHRIAWSPVGKPAQVMHVPESWCSWEPA